MTPDNNHNRGYLQTVLGCYCPRCREGKIFQHPLSIGLSRNLQMYKNCPVCEQPTEIEVGFYYGTGYVSYALAVAISVATLIAWWVLIGFSFEDRRFFFWMGANAVVLIGLQPWLMRFARSLWLSWFVRFDPEWKNHGPVYHERIDPNQMEN